MSDISDRIKREIEFGEARIASLRAQVDWLKENAALIGEASVNVQIYGGAQLDINNPSREKALEIIKAIPGDWEKEDAGEGMINYVLTVSDRLKIRLFRAPPPPSCRIVEEEYVVPAQPERIEKRRKLVCVERKAEQLTQS